MSLIAQQREYAEVVTGIAPANLLRYYPLLGIGSELVRDLASGANGTAEGGLVGGGARSLVYGESEPTALFDGSNDAIDCGAPPTLTTAFTVSMWTQFTDYVPASGSKYYVAVYDTTGNRRSWSIGGTATNNFQVSFGDPADGTFEGAAYSTANWSPTDNTRYHIAVTYAAGTVLYYVDGVLKTWNIHSGIPVSLYQSAAPLMIGTSFNRTAGTFIGGSVDGPSIWNTVLDINQIQSLYRYGV
jgi:hypothetical protein